VAANPADLNRKPRLAEPACIQDNLHVPRGASGEGETIRVRFSVGLDGVPADLAFLNTPSDPRVDHAIRTAIGRCLFTPGTDARGTPSVQSVLMPFRIDAR
jgi:outer membrane biosynthesis protein TonB